MSTIKCTLDNLAKTLEKEVQKEVKQAKFAAMKALNNVAFKARDNLIKNYNASFKVRNKSLPKAVAVKKATKENLQAEVEFPKDWMEINVKGGTKQADSGKTWRSHLTNLKGVPLAVRENQANETSCVSFEICGFTSKAW